MVRGHAGLKPGLTGSRAAQGTLPTGRAAGGRRRHQGRGQWVHEIGQQN